MLAIQTITTKYAVRCSKYHSIMSSMNLGKKRNLHMLCNIKANTLGNYSCKHFLIRYMSDDTKSTAYQQLLNSLSALSNSNASAKPLINAPESYLKEKESVPIEESSILDLNQLAMSYFTNAKKISDPKEQQQNIDKAIKYWSETADRGDVEGSYQIASLQYEGKHMKQDIPGAFEVLEELADDFEHPMSHYLLGVMYSKGHPPHVRRSDVLAFSHFKKASKEGILPAFHNLANYHASGIDPDREQWKQISHNKHILMNDDNEPMSSLPRDIPLAARYYDFASQHGDPHSCFLLANWYLEGVAGKDKVAFEKNIAKGLEYMNKAVSIGHPLAMFNMAVFYMSGLKSDGSVVIQNQNIQRKQYQDRQNVAHADATVVLEPDLLKSLQLYDRASVSGYAPASLNLGQIFHHGFSTVLDSDGKKSVEVKKDLSKAYEIYKRHASIGFQPCVEQLKLVERELKK